MLQLALSSARLLTDLLAKSNRSGAAACCLRGVCVCMYTPPRPLPLLSLHPTALLAVPSRPCCRQLGGLSTAEGLAPQLPSAL